MQRTYIARNYFNETQGTIYVDSLSVKACPHLSNLATCPYYLALSACGALLRYIEHSNNMVFPPCTLMIRFKPKEGSLFVDMATIEGLELLENGLLHTQSRKSRTKGSQLSAMDRTKTRAGKRFLRRTILEPPAELPTIRLRQDAVEEIASNESLYYNAVAVLQTFPDLERALACLLAQESSKMRRIANESRATSSHSKPSSTLSSGSSKRGTIDQQVIDGTKAPCMTIIRNVIYLKAAIDAIWDLLKEMQGVESTLLVCYVNGLQSTVLNKLRDALDDVIVPEATASKDVEQMRLQGAFAVKANRNGKISFPMFGRIANLFEC